MSVLEAQRAAQARNDVVGKGEPLLAMGRYQRRAFSRRKFAVRVEVVTFSYNYLK
jgi:hypothetical protein